ncbi:MAG TPA: YraN family protein, partial [Stenomitos sp.]
MSKSPQSRIAEVGRYGEALVAQWLQQQGWKILAQRWTSRWGEIDIVALNTADRHLCVAFVEVKTRSRGSWDKNGLDAITTAKQTKLWKTAQFFLSQHPELADATCQFDVALVEVKPKAEHKTAVSSLPITLGEAVIVDNYALTLQTYLEAA